MKSISNDNSTTVIPKDNLQSAANNNTIKGVLTRVYKFFLVSFGKDRTPVWNKLMDNYINDPNNRIPLTRNKQTSAKGNMKREYLGSQLSWPKFCEAMRFAKFSHLEIIFIAEDENGERMKMTEKLNFKNMSDADFDIDILTNFVHDVTDKSSFDEIDETDARIQAQNMLNNRGGKRKITSAGSDWVNRPAKFNIDVEEIIKNNTHKTE